MDFLMATIFGLTAVAWWLMMMVLFLVLYLFFGLVNFLRGKGRPALTGQKIYDRLADHFYKRYAWWSRQEMAGFIKKGERVLDIGCGNGYVDLEIVKKTGAKVVGVDIVDLDKTGRGVKIFDGKNLPFEDKSFEVALLVYVLHHAGHNQKKILEEAKRVSKKRIIIFEDELVGIGGWWHNLIHAREYDFLNKIENNNECVFRSPEEWEEIFRNLDLKILEKKRSWCWGAVIRPAKRCFWVLGIE